MSEEQAYCPICDLPFEVHGRHVADNGNLFLCEFCEEKYAPDSNSFPGGELCGRHRLPDERQSLTHKFDITGYKGYITAGKYDDDTCGEIFVCISKEGSMLSGLADGFATAVSIALQYGVPLEVYVEKFTNTRFEPSGVTRNPEIPIAKSLLDYIFRWLELKFLSKQISEEQPKDDELLLYGSVEGIKS